MAAVSLAHVSKLFKAKEGKVRAIDDLSLEVCDGELMVLVGPSGCGKTTALRLIAGLEEPSAGMIQIGGRDVAGVAPKDRDVAMVFQSYALYPHMTVYKNMAFGLKMRGVPKNDIKVRVHAVSAMLGIGHLLDRRPAALSGGEQQRVALGRAIVRTPRVFLFDEPLSNLDAKLRTNMRAEIKSLHRSLGTTVIYVTHDQEEAMTLGDRIAVINKGALQQCGRPLEIYNNPANLFVADFIGAPAMNLLQGSLALDGQTIWFSCSAGRLKLPEPLAGRLKAQDRNKAVLAIRPQYLKVLDGAAFAAESSAKYRAKVSDGVIEPSHIARGLAVTLVEQLGDATNVHLRTAGGETLVARAAADVSISTGERAHVLMDLSRAHVFEPGLSGARLA